MSEPAMGQEFGPTHEKCSKNVKFIVRVGLALPYPGGHDLDHTCLQSSRCR